MSCGVGHRCSLDLELLWLWPVPVPATLIQPLAWRLPYAMGAAQVTTVNKRGQASLKYCLGVPVVAQWLTNPTRNQEVSGSVPALAQRVNNPVLP